VVEALAIRVRLLDAGVVSQEAHLAFEVIDEEV
jgi:hypothetical protein